MSITFGPIPSRRLGLSLGIDVIPRKTCTYNCIYCQLGATSRTTVRRGAFTKPQAVLEEVQEALRRGIRPDFLTFSGSGEPTLCLGIGEMIRLLKGHLDIKVAVLTNGSLLSRRSVREELIEADVVMPSLDAASPEAFRRINRPHPSIGLTEVLEGTVRFRERFRGQLWLEVLLVSGVNDSMEELLGIKRWVERIQPDRVQLNTVVRPPAQRWARPVEASRLEEIASVLGPNTEVIAEFPSRPATDYGDQELEDRVIQMAMRRALCAEDLHGALGLDVEQANDLLRRLAAREGWRIHSHQGREYYSVDPSKGRIGPAEASPERAG